MQRTPLRSLWLLTLIGCQAANDNLQPYYDGDGGPEISGLSVTSETGNIGGHELTINGSGFGNDPEMITVIIGSQNTDILSVSDSSITVVSPRGPIEGGAVDVRVGGADGQDTLEGAYTYDLGDFYSNQVAYIGVTNDWMSYFGGYGLGQGYGATGLAGMEGNAQFLEFLFPRLHTIYIGQNLGFGGSADWSWEEWALETPSQTISQYLMDDFYDSLRTDVGNFTLTNVGAEQNMTSGQRQWCADGTALASWYWGGGTGADGNYYPAIGAGSGATLERSVDCSSASAIEYDLAQVNFCEPEEYTTPHTYRFEAEWPIAQNFFAGVDERGSYDDELSSDIQIDLPEIGLEGIQVTLPPVAAFYATEGWDVTSEGEWLYGQLYGPQGTCADSDGDGLTTGDDAALAIEWEPALDFVPATGDRVLGARVWVRFSVSYVTSGWLGGMEDAMKATITVPDDYNYDESTGRSRIELPASSLGVSL